MVGQRRLLWKTVRRLLHSGSGAAWYVGLDTTNLATRLCDFFTNKVKQVKTKVESSLRNAPNNIIAGRLPSLHTQPAHQSFARVPSTEVQRLIASAPIKTSPLDRLPISAAKACSDEFSVVIAHIANTSFAYGRFPSLWKAGWSPHTQKARHRHD